MAEEDKVEVQEEVGEVEEAVQVEEELSTQDVMEKELARIHGDSENETPTFEEAQDAQAQDIEASKEETTEDVTTPQQEHVGDTEEQGEEIKLSDEDNEFMGKYIYPVIEMVALNIGKAKEGSTTNPIRFVKRSD